MALMSSEDRLGAGQRWAGKVVNSLIRINLQFKRIEHYAGEPFRFVPEVFANTPQEMARRAQMAKRRFSFLNSLIRCFELRFTWYDIDKIILVQSHEHPLSW
jgi:hypothetical protein